MADSNSDTPQVEPVTPDPQRPIGWLKPSDADPGSPLTPRETEVAYAIGRGLSRREAGNELGMSEHTVSTHVGFIYRKLGVENQVEMLIALGLVVIPDTHRVALIVDLAGLRVRLTELTTALAGIIEDVNTAEQRLMELVAEATNEPGSPGET